MNVPHEWINQINNPEYAEVIANMKAALPAAAAPLSPGLAKKKTDRANWKRVKQ